MTDPARIAMLRALDPDAAVAFYTSGGHGGPRDNARDKTMVRVHKERVACPDLTDEERAVSQAWLDARKAQRTR